jgi:hypothetical protein
MSRLAIRVDEEVLKRARMLALQLGSSVNAELRKPLEACEDVDEAQSAAARNLLAMPRETERAAGSGII